MLRTRVFGLQLFILKFKSSTNLLSFTGAEKWTNQEALGRHYRLDWFT